MNAPFLPFGPHDLEWTELPIVAWLFAAILTFLVMRIRHGEAASGIIAGKYRAFWIVTLAIAIVAAVVIYVRTDPVMPSAGF